MRFLLNMTLRVILHYKGKGAGLQVIYDNQDFVSINDRFFFRAFFT